MISKRLFLSAAWLTLVPFSALAFAQEDAPEKPAENQPAEEAKDEPVAPIVEVTSDSQSEAEGTDAGSQSQGTFRIAVAAMPGHSKQVTDKVKSLLEKNGVNEDVIKQIMPELEKALDENPGGGPARIQFDNGKATVFASGVFIDSDGKQQKIRFQDNVTHAADALDKNKAELDQKLKAVEEAKLQLQKSVEALQMQQRSMNGQQQMLEAQLPMIRTLQVQQVPYTLGIQLQIEGKEEDAKQVIIAEVLPESAAAETGLKVGDVITKANDQTVASPLQLRELVQAAGEAQQAIELQWQREGETMTATITPKKNDQLVMPQWLQVMPGGNAFAAPPMTFGMNPHEQMHRQLHEQLQAHQVNNPDWEVKSETRPDGSRVIVMAPKVATAQQPDAPQQASIDELKSEIQSLRDELRALTETLKSR